VSRNLAFCCLAVVAFLTMIVRHADSAGCGDSGLFAAWGLDRPAPVSAIDRDRWFRASLGWIVAPGECAAREVAVEMDAASSAFERHFGLAAPDGVVVDLADAGHAPALRAAGAAWVLPWRFDTTAPEDGAQAAAIREQVRSRLAARGGEPDPEQVEALVERALAQLGGHAGPAPPALEPTAIRHEIAHLLFMHAVWPASGDEQYGGGAPDWLDEAAAVIAESEAMTRQRRALFRELVASGRTIPLSEYLEMPHPVYADAQFRALVDRARAARQAGEPIVVSASVADGQSERARAFYAQTRGFVDYQIARTGDERVLHDIAVGLREESADFGDWLQGTGAVRGLPAEIRALERDFLESARL
jgi:hypothetical protein